MQVLLLSLAICCLAAPQGFLRHPRAGAIHTASLPRPAQAPSFEEVGRGISLATSYLERATSAQGKFVYRVNTESGAESDSYNIIRHAGTMYALGMLYRSHPDPRIADLLVRSGKYLRQNYIGPGDRPGELVVWSKPQPQIGDAQLGATALGIVALAEVEHVRPKSIRLNDMEALGRFALSLQKENGSFYSRYRPGSGPVLDWESLYYPGEAALAFVTLYEQDHSREWLFAARKALGYLARTRAGLSTVPADHWALIATARLLPYCGHGECPVAPEVLVRHAIQICDSILRDQTNGPEGPLAGAFDPTGRTTPTATRMEGLLATLEFLPAQDAELRTRIKAAVRHGIAFLLRAQIKSGPYAGGMPGTYIPRGRDASEIRIDYVQHAVCAWLRYQELLRSK